MLAGILALSCAGAKHEAWPRAAVQAPAASASSQLVASPLPAASSIQPSGDAAESDRASPEVADTHESSFESVDANDGGEVCPQLTVVSGLVRPLRGMSGFLELYRTLLAELPNGDRSPRTLTDEADAHALICAMIAVRADRAQEVLFGDKVPSVKGKPPCDSPGPHWIQLYPWNGPAYERWQLTPIDQGKRIVAVVQERRDLAGPEFNDDLWLTREGRFVVLVEGRSRWACEKERTKRCILEPYRTVCPSDENQRCLAAGYDARVVVYDPLTDESAVFGPYLAQSVPRIELKGDVVGVRTSTCHESHSFRR